ncbi:MAG: hypothetical protein O3B31_02965, partial [Chloroflexi bacterium]|nr:hypothetical protein [Chloroflexota bacterium]
ALRTATNPSRSGDHGRIAGVAGGPASGAAVRRTTSTSGPPLPAVLARATTSALPVGGLGSAVGAVSDVATRVATATAQRTVAASVERSTTVDRDAPDAVVRRRPDAALQRAVGDAPVEAMGPDPADGDRRRQEWLEFATDEEFMALLMQQIEDRVMDAIERRGGRYGGWFA